MENNDDQQAFPMNFVPYEDLGDRPNIIADGAAQGATVLTLSHWPKSGTPAHLKRDTSAAIAFAYLDAAEPRVKADAVSNNHFDEDGLIAMFALTNPETALLHRDLLIDAASAGDFGVYTRPDAVRISFTIAALADPATSPLPRRVFELEYPAQVAALYRELLGLLPEVLSHPERYEKYWIDQERHLLNSVQMIANGRVALESMPELDLAIVRIPDNRAESASEAGSMDAACHPYALYTASPFYRMLLVRGSVCEFRYRYESWVQLVSRRPAPRVDLGRLTAKLNAMERSGGHWIFEGLEQITPRLYLEGASQSTISPVQFRDKLISHLRREPPAWDPYD